MKATVSTVGIYVDNQERAKQFWVDKLGFEVRADFPMGSNANWLEVCPKGAETALVIYPKSMMTNWQELKPSVVFTCDDIYQAHRDLTERGVEFTMNPTEMQFGIFAQFQDEDGNIFGLKQPQ